MALSPPAVYPQSLQMPSSFAPHTYPTDRWTHCLAFLVLALVLPCLSQAQSIDEAAVIRLAAKNNPESGVFDQTISVQDAASKKAALRQNPEISWEREHLPFSAEAESEDALVLSIPINRSPSQRIARSLAQADIALAQGEALRNRSEVVKRALELFYVGVAQKQQIEIEEEAGQRLAEAARIIKRRREEGRVSGYDLARVQLESELARSRVQEAKTTHAALRIRLARMLGLSEATLGLAGALQPNVLLKDSHNGREHPALLALRSAARHAREASAQAKHFWMPVFSVSAGLKIAHGHDTNVGYVAGLSFPLPVWGERGPQRAQTLARHHLADARAHAMRVKRSVESATALQTLQGLRVEADRFRRATAAQVLALQRAAESGYREGERNLVELLDASRTRLSIQARQVELDLAIKQAEITLRAARGEFE